MAERKDLIQDIQTIEASDLLASIADIKSAGYRLGQACATKTEGGIEALYSFEKDETLKNLKVCIQDRDPELQSISGIYWAAFIYENEMHDLFGITFKNLALDFGGHFFKIATETPWNPMEKRSAAEADATATVEKDADAVAEAEEADATATAEKDADAVAEATEADATATVEKDADAVAEDSKAAKKETKAVAEADATAAEKSGKKKDEKSVKLDKKDKKVKKGGEA
jgi:ech hydrogenase subunit D